MILRPHQKRIVDANKKNNFLVWAMRVGKSLPAKLWSEHPSRSKNVIIVCKKQNKTDWILLCPHATVYTKEEIKKYWKTIVDPTALIIDESHCVFSPLFIAKKRSAITESIYHLIMQNPDMDTIMLTATPLTNEPASIHTALWFLGIRIDWKKFQEKMYRLERRPYLPRPAWFPAPDWRAKANNLLRKYADIVSLEDATGYLPEVTEEVVPIKTKPIVKTEEDTWHTEHMAEQVGKVNYIKDMPFRKIIVVCYYKEQIKDIAKQLSTYRPTYTLSGDTKNPYQTIQQAQVEEDCFFIVQSSMGLGWDGYMFGAMVFCSMDHRVLNHTQMVGRLTSVDYPKPLFYYYLVGGKWDRKIYESIKAGEDFNIHKGKC